MPSIGIIGAGQIGTAIATALARSGIPATLANSRGPETLADTVAALAPSITAGTREEGLEGHRHRRVNWSKLPTALAGLRDFGNRIVIDANNPIEAPLFKPFDLGDRSSSEVFASFVPGARVVKAFNHRGQISYPGDPAGDGGRRRAVLLGATTDRRRRRSKF